MTASLRASIDHDEQRVALVSKALADASLDAVVCALPANVVMLTGYWPVVGTAIAVATRRGEIVLLPPRDEEDLARKSRANVVLPVDPPSFDEGGDPYAEIFEKLKSTAVRCGIGDGRIGYETGDDYEPASYASMRFYGGGLATLVGRTFRNPALAPADRTLRRLRSVKTASEIAMISEACSIVGEAFATGAGALEEGVSEIEAATRFREPLSLAAISRDGIERADGYVSVMSGPNAALAQGAYARSRSRRLRRGDFVLVHCNSYVDGFWTDVTRTYCLGPIDDRMRAMYEAVFAARDAALDAIRPGVAAADVDEAARHELSRRGYGKNFKHGTGHEVGFSAINAMAMPRLKPGSRDVLDEGMTFNVEPAIYMDGYGGLRHCDVVAVRATGAEVLTPFHDALDDLVVATEGGKPNKEDS